MKTVYLDTNVVIDYLARREAFYHPAALVVSACGMRDARILVSALSFATASYILSAHYKMSIEDIRHLFQNFMDRCHVVSVDVQNINHSIHSEFSDFEDAMQYYAALSEGADVIITRNKQDFEKSEILVFEPQEFLDFIMIE